MAVNSILIFLFILPSPVLIFINKAIDLIYLDGDSFMYD